MNHLNQEKATLLEKVEHSERDLQVNVSKSNQHVDLSSQLSEFGMNNVREAYKNYSSNGDSMMDREFEFYFEKNIRP